MDVLTLILACSVFPDDSLVRAMVELASQGNPHFVGDMTTLATFDKTATVPAAEHLVAELGRQGGRPVVGLMGLPPSWAVRYGRSRQELYDGCVNIWVGTAVLSSHYESCVAAHAAIFTPAKAGDRQKRVAPPEAVRLCALRRFGADLGVDGYAESILRLLPKQRLLFTPANYGHDAQPAHNDMSCRCPEDEEELVLPPPAKRRPKVAPNKLAPILD